MKKTNKKIRGQGQIPASIIAITIAIISLIIILFVYFILNPGKTVDQTTCHNSVVERASAPIGGLTREAIPLQCKTDYICISEDGSCEKMTNPEVITVKTKDDVYSALAQKMADCWNTWGLGKLNYIGDKFDNDLYCSICDQVGFDNSLQKIFPPTTLRSEGIAGQNGNNANISWINNEDFYNYLATHNVSGQDVSYLEYLTGLTDTSQIKNALSAQNSGFGSIMLDSQYFIVMGEFAPVGKLNDILSGIWKGAALVLAIPATLLGSNAAVNLIISTFPSNPTADYMIGTIVHGDSGQYYITPTLIAANSADYSKLKCADVKTLS